MEHLIGLIKDVGYYGYFILFIIIFLESFPLTFYLPGDSLLFTTGFLASQGYFSMAILLPTLFIASILGYNFSYFMGERLRNFILKSNDKYWFKKKHLDYTQDFYNKYGDKTLIIGRFVPVVRSFAPTLAGAVNMSFKKFTIDSVFGGFLWTIGVTSIGFYLGRVMPGVEKYLHYMVFLIIFVSLLPSVYEYWVSRKNKTKA
ncbi:MAG: membrane-associated protein [Parcubacteria bacterium C7867-006]|nr:MAG: membrane-associated protein [Parcubacteria bacterium C7867-006]